MADASVEKLETFCRLLAQVNEDLRADAAAAEQRATALERDEAALERDLDGLTQDLDDAEERVESSGAAAAAALESAAESARAGATRLQREEAELEDAESAFAGHTAGNRDALEKAGDGLEGNGRAPSVASVEEVKAGLEQSSDRASAAFDGLDADLATHTETVEVAGEHGTIALAEQSSETDTTAESIVSEGLETGIELDGMREPFLVADLSEAQEVDDGYETLRDSALGKAAFLWTSVMTDARAWVGDVGNEVVLPVSGAGEEACAQAQDCAANASLGGGSIASMAPVVNRTVGPMAEELEKALQVVPVIAEMLAALE